MKVGKEGGRKRGKRQGRSKGGRKRKRERDERSTSEHEGWQGSRARLKREREVGERKPVDEREGEKAWDCNDAKHSNLAKIYISKFRLRIAPVGTFCRCWGMWNYAGMQIEMRLWKGKYQTLFYCLILLPYFIAYLLSFVYYRLFIIVCLLLLIDYRLFIIVCLLSLAMLF